MVTEIINNLFGKISATLWVDLLNRYRKMRTPTIDIFEEIQSLPSKRYQKNESFYKNNITLKDRYELMQKSEFKDISIYLRKIVWIRLSRKRYLIYKLIGQKVHSFDTADEVLVWLVILFPRLRKKDIEMLLEKHGDNEQIQEKMQLFLNDIFELKPKLLNKKAKCFIQNTDNA